MRIALSSCEPSGDVIAAELARELRSLASDCAVLHLRPAASGRSVIGFGAGMLAARRSGPALATARREVARTRPDVVVLIAYPGLHLALGRALRQKGIRVIYLAPPQVWAWGRWRAGLLRMAADVVVCLFEFEARLLRSLGVDADYFGYPLLDMVVREARTGEGLRSEPATPYVALLPGSRPLEVARHAPLFAEVRARLGAELTGVGWRMVRPDERPRYAVMAGAVCALAASGTVTAELALLRIPTVVCYCLPRLESTLARLLVRTRYFALPNIIAGSAVVTELLNPDANVLQSALRLLLVSSSARERVRAGLGAVARRLGPEGGMKRVARLVLDRACGSSRTPPGGQAA